MSYSDTLRIAHLEREEAVNTMRQYQRFNSQYPGKEVITGALWDTLQYPQAGALRLEFFAANRATLDLSNMTGNGQLPQPESFLVRSIQVYIKNRPESTATAAAGAVQADSLEDIANIVHNGALTFIVGQKDYGIYPVDCLPAGGGPWGTLCVNDVLIAGAAVSYANNGFPHTTHVFALAVPVLIAPQINFRCAITWAALLPIIRATMIQVALVGDSIRAIQ
jgi:hypothetical protein